MQFRGLISDFEPSFHASPAVLYIILTAISRRMTGVALGITSSSSTIPDSVASSKLDLEDLLLS